MKSYLIDIDNELHNYYKQFIDSIENNSLQPSNINHFTDNVVALLDYYIEPIFNSGKKIITKRLNTQFTKNKFAESEQSFIDGYRKNYLNQFKENLNKAIENCFDDRENDKEFYEDLVQIIIADCIKLFKYAQLSECINNNITEVKINTDNDSCPICRTKLQFKQSTAKLMKEIDNLHSFCKFSIDLNINNQISNIQQRLKISLPELITDKEFVVVEDVVSIPEFADILRNKYDEEKVSKILEQINNRIAVFEVDNKIFLSKNCLNKLQYFVTRALLKDKLMQYDLSWWEEEYKKKQESKYVGDNVAIYAEPFVSYIAEQDYKSYFLESAIYFILDPDLLKVIDQENYNQLQKQIFGEE